jgi:HIV-1 Vpr-binding protein
VWLRPVVLTAILLQVIAHAYDWTFQGRSETVRCSLDTLAMCSLLPKVQLIFCERIRLFEENSTVGMSIILSAAEGEIVQVNTA